MKLHTTFILLLAVGSLFAQPVDFNKVVAPEGQRVKTFEEYLVQLAWMNSPQNKILNTKVAIADNEITLEKRDWHNDLQVAFNLNEISLSKLIYGDQLDIPVFYPIYNFTATFKLGTITTRKPKIETAKLEKLIAEQDVNQEMLNLRQDVLERYQEYLQSIEVLKIRTEAEETAYNIYIIINEKFNQGKAEVEDQSRASNNYFNSKEARAEAETNVRITKYALEELIGVPYESAQKYGPK